MSRIRQVMVLGATWVTLFAIAVGIAATRESVALGGRVRPVSSGLDPLHALPLKTDAVGIAELAQTDPNAYAALQDEIFKSKDVVRHCKDLVLAGSVSEQEWFEVSFEVRAGPGQLFHLEDILLERGTVDLTTEAEQCIVSAFGDMQLELDAPPNVRIRYPFCFNRKQTDAIGTETQE